MMAWEIFIPCLMAYTAMLAIPFMPALEVGLVLMVAFGKPGIVLVYTATVAGLAIAYAMGRLVPQDRLPGWIRRPGGSLPKVGPVAVGLLLNTPCNSALGGGGGIALACGAARFMPPAKFLVVAILAPLPIPVLALLGLITL